MSDQDCGSTISTCPLSLSTPVAAVGRCDSQRLRNNLMYKLGVEIKQANQECPSRPQESILGGVRVIQPLKSSHKDEEKETTTGFWPFAALFRAKEASELLSFGERDEHPSLTSSFASEADERSSSSRSADSSRKLRFNEQVEVCLIPKRDEYSKRIRVHLWFSPEEMAAAAHRNTVEFAAEGWDPMNCMEEENMYRCLSTNELIHPVHIEQPDAISSP